MVDFMIIFKYNLLCCVIYSCSSTREELADAGKTRNKNPICNLRRTTGAGTTTGFEVYFKGMNKFDSMGDGQRDRDGARVGWNPNTPKI